MDKQKLEEARQLAMSMTSHPVAFGTIEHTEKAGELLAELVHALDQKHAEYEDLKACAANNARNLAREAHTWSKAAETYAADAELLRAALRQLVDVDDMRLRLRQLHEIGHGTDYTDYHRLLPLAWAAAREALGPNVMWANRPPGDELA